MATKPPVTKPERTSDLAQTVIDINNYVALNTCYEIGTNGYEEKCAGTCGQQPLSVRISIVSNDQVYRVHVFTARSS